MTGTGRYIGRSQVCSSLVASQEVPELLRPAVGPKRPRFNSLGGHDRLSIKKKNYLYKRQSYREKGKDREVFHLLSHSANGHNNITRPRAWSSTQVSHEGAKGSQKLGPSSVALPGALAGNQVETRATRTLSSTHWMPASWPPALIFQSL